MMWQLFEVVKDDNFDLAAYYVSKTKDELLAEFPILEKYKIKLCDYFDEARAIHFEFEGQRISGFTILNNLAPDISKPGYIGGSWNPEEKEDIIIDAKELADELGLNDQNLYEDDGELKGFVNKAK